ncbi:MAG: hypothetical protein PHR77_01460 [Kiritimatiellae bacterium]|nr:hypothetical protein [Kiritimatiellia bacterium]MDD5521743.1 hypothetical protein [Kiritimatiellia bacterium]
MNGTRQIAVLSRRQFLGTFGMAFYIFGKRKYSLKNDALRFCITLNKGTISARSFENRIVNQAISLPTEEFLLEFDGGSTVSSGSMELKPGAIDDHAIDLLFSESSGLEVRVRYSLPPRSCYLRKQISVRQMREPARRLFRANLENWQGVKRNWDSMHADRFPYGSHPVFSDNIWAGVEFVAAFNEYGPDGFTLRSRPGGISIGTEWVDLHSTVIGVAEAGGVRDAFLRYIEDIRLAPARMVACYNSWWTLPKVVKQLDNLALIKELKAAMYEQHGAFFDIITTDMGWSKPQSIWEIDHSILPQGFDDIRGIVESAGGKLGIWMSPSEVYPPVCDYDWAEKNGYFVLRPDLDNPPGQRPISRQPGVSLADPKYRSETKEQLKKLIRENGLGHIKYDGFWAIEHRPHHGLLPHEDSVEPLATYSLELLQASKEANPNLVTEPTYLNSIVNYISPWIIKYSDTVWANAEDCVVGIGPAPDYRESHTNAREHMIFKSLDQVWLPQDTLHYFDIIHVDAHEGFPNHAAMAFGRGRFFVSTYLNPKLMNDEDWRIYAGLLRWARQNSDLLRNTRVIPSRVELGEPYIYAHWLGARGILAVRNPSNESRAFVVDLGKAGAPSELTNAICYTQYPYRRGIATGLTGRSQISLNLAPWELLFLEIVDCSQLKETVAVGARWYRESDGTMSIVSDRGVKAVRLFEPGKKQQIISVASKERDNLSGELRSHSVRQAPESKWLDTKSRTTALFPFKYPAELTPETIQKVKGTEWKNVKWKKVPTVDFEVECSVSVPRQAGSGKVLLLVEFPGREHRPSRCDGWLDDRQVSLEESSSEEHIGYFNWKDDLRPFESEWCWYICSVPSGSHRIKFSGTAGHPNPRLGLWIWADYELIDRMYLASVHCSDSVMPQYRDRLERQGVCLMPPKAMP